MSIQQVIAPKKASEWVLPHALVKENEAGWQARVRREKGRPTEFGNTSIFTYNDAHYVVGNEAMRSGELTRVVGQAKYKEGYFDVLAVAALLKLYPEGHNNIIMSCAHSANSIPFVEQMGNAVGKLHKVTKVDGTTVKYAVRGFVSWDEPAGGLWRFATANGNLKGMPIGSRICVVDIGGKISSMYIAEVLPEARIQVYWSNGIAMDLGVQDFTKSLNEELPNLYPEVFQNTRSIPEQMLRDCLRNKGKMNVKGDEFDASQAYKNATGSLMDGLRNTWITEMAGGLNVDMVVVTGGGGGAMFSSIVDDFDHKHIYLADDMSAIELANLRGGDTISASWYSANYKKLPTAKDGNRPVVVVLDAGNSGLKFKVCGA